MMINRYIFQSAMTERKTRQSKAFSLVADLFGREPFAGVFGGIYKEPEAREAGQD
jgi:hypothetical protein